MSHHVQDMKTREGTFSPSVLLSKMKELKEAWPSSSPSLQSRPSTTKPMSRPFSWWAANTLTSCSWNWVHHTHWVYIGCIYI